MCPIMTRAGETKATVSWMSWITALQGASAFFFSSGRRITVMLLLSEGAAGRTVSPIWSQTLAADLLYVCSKTSRSWQPHTWQATHSNPTLTQISERRAEISAQILRVQDPVIQFRVTREQRSNSCSTLKEFVHKFTRFCIAHEKKEKKKDVFLITYSLTF